MTLKQHLSGIALAAYAALAVPAYAAPPTMESGRFVPAKKAGRKGGKPTLEKRLRTYQAETTQQVRELNEKYTTVQKTVEQLTSPENTYFTEVLKQAVGERFTQLTGLKKSMDSNCQTAVNNYVALAQELTTTYDDMDFILTDFETINQNKELLPFAKANLMKTVLDNIVSHHEEYTDELRADLASKLNENTIANQYKACHQVATTYAGTLAELVDDFQRNVYETEEQKQARIKRVIKATVPSMIPKSRVGLSTLVGASYSPKTGFDSSIGAGVDYQIVPRITISAEGSLVLSSPKDQIKTSEPNFSTTAIGPGYQQQSSVDESAATHLRKHYDLGARISANVLQSGNFSLYAGISAKAYGGEQTTTTSRTRTSQLQDAKGTTLGTAHSITDRQERNEDVRSFVPALDIEACQKDIVCLRLGGAYDSLYNTGIAFAYLVGRFF
ncbi:hypothetical protein HYX11_02935 [Candidatus Woesearchaeota archaeon]|nr:hypothetical protein [Candidatus Woesearchaeota archaeon]